MPIGPGSVVLVVGPSGSGKDTLLRGAAAALSRDASVFFPRRLVTRPADPALEDHDTLSFAEFESRVARGEAALSWQAHGLGYIVPRTVDDHVARGGTAVFNCSRAAIGRAAERYHRVDVVQVTVPDDVLARRLAQRGRESAEDVKARLARADLAMPSGTRLTKVVNDGTIEQGVATLVNAIRNCAVEG